MPCRPPNEGGRLTGKAERQPPAPGMDEVTAVVDHTSSKDADGHTQLRQAQRAVSQGALTLARQLHAHQQPQSLHSAEEQQKCKPLLEC